MNRIAGVVVLGVALYLLPTLASGQSQVSYYPNSVGGHRTYMATLVVDARPLDAEVVLDGRPIGVARDLMALAVTIEPGRHLLEVRARAHQPYSSLFTADSHDSVNRFTVRLPPIR